MSMSVCKWWRTKCTSRAAVAAGLAVIAIAGSLDRASAADESLCKTITCFANGGTSCDRSTADCPPCIYTVPSGYSCYGKVGNACPFPDSILTCSEPTPKPTASPGATPSAATPTATASASTSPVPSSSTTIVTAPAPPKSSSHGSKAGSGHGAGSGKTGSTRGSRGGSGDDASTSSEASQSPAYVNIAVIAGAALGIVIVCLFIIRRMKRRNQGDEALKTPDYQNNHKQFTLQLDSTSSGRGHSISGHDQPGRGVGATNATRPVPVQNDRMSSGSDIQSLLSMSSVTSSTIEFNHSQYDDRSTAGSMNNTAIYRGGAPVTANGPRTRARPKSIVEDEEMLQSNNMTNRMQIASLGIHGGVPQTRKRGNSNRSDVSGMSIDDEYDIVDPGTMSDAERRNTETLVRDGRFRFFSTVSLTDSDISTDDGVDVDSFSKEHEI